MMSAFVYEQNARLKMVAAATPVCSQHDMRKKHKQERLICIVSWKKFLTFKFVDVKTD